ncbi:hypothetical protein PYCC9005_000466 [Savitreella phatthalungensis]
MPYKKSNKRKREGGDEGHHTDGSSKRHHSQQGESGDMLRAAGNAAKAGARAAAGRGRPSGKSFPAAKAGRMGGKFGQSKQAGRGGFGRKSGFGEGSGGRGSRGPSFAASLNIHNEEHIYNNFAVPQGSEYGLSFEPVDQASKIISDSAVLLQRQFHLERAGYTDFRDKCTTMAELDEGILITAQGHGRDKAEAERNADLHLLCLLHEQGLLKEILPGGKYASVPQALLINETEAKRDIINFAARHDCLPVFKASAGRSRIKKTLTAAIVEIPALGLRGFGRAKSQQIAEQQACVSLKRAAEVFHEREGDGLLLIKDYTKLTLASARQFIDYYGMIHRRWAELDEKQLGGGSRYRTDWVVSVSLDVQESKAESRAAAIAADDETMEASDTDGTPTGTYVKKSFQGIQMGNKKDAEDTAYLAAALEIKKLLPQLWKDFVREMKRGNGEVLKPLRPIDIHIDYDVIEMMRATVRESNFLLPRVKTQQEAEVAAQAARRDAIRRILTPDQLQRKNDRLRDSLVKYESDDSLADLRQKRHQLPMVQNAQSVLDMVNSNSVCVVGAATGSGKTTQLPQLILEQASRAGEGALCNIICTQPRRIAAMSVAQRVAVERNEKLQQSVGYQVRFDAKLPQSGGSITYCTTGILLRQIQDASDAALEGISHILVDEVHERDIQIDFLLVLLKQISKRRREQGLKEIKLVLMSATIDTTLFCKYFGDGFAEKRCPHIEVPGRAFPVTQHFLDDFHPELKQLYSGASARELVSKDTIAYVERELRAGPVSVAPSAPASANASQANSVVDGDISEDKAVINWKSKGVIAEDGSLDVSTDKEDTMTPVGLVAITIAHLLKYTTEGSILAFLPGLAEITATEKLLKQGVLGVDMSAYKTYTLHSAVPAMQQEVFEKTATRKVILSTNIAETSITIPDVVYVVDSGKHRENQFDQAKRISSLVSTWISKSNSRQRAGRAGRVQHGHYYTLLSRARFDSLDIQSQPEILRIDLQELCLQIKGMGIEDVQGFLAQAIEPPSPAAIENSMDHLQALNALDGEGRLLPLGRVLSTFPVQPSLGKMALLGALFKCLDPVLILAAASTARDPFVAPLLKRAEAENVRRSWARDTGSDLMAVLYAFQEWRAVRARGGDDRGFAMANFLHYNTMQSIAQTAEQVLELMHKTGIVASQGRTGKRASIYGAPEDNVHSGSLPLVAALATAGFYPNVAVQTSSPRLLRTAHENGAQIHPTSLAAPKTATGARYGPIRSQDAYPYGSLLTYAQKTQADQSQVFLRGLTQTTPLSVVLFGGSTEREGAVLRIDGWIPFYARGPQMSSTLDLHRVLDVFLSARFASIGTTSRRHLLGSEDRDAAAEDAAQQAALRDVLVPGVVHALEAAHKKVEMTLPTSFRRSAGPSRTHSPAGSRATSRSSSYDRASAPHNHHANGASHNNRYHQASPYRARGRPTDEERIFSRR